MSAPPIASVDVDAAVRFVQAIHGHERAGFVILMLMRRDMPPAHYGFDLGNPRWDALRRVLTNYAGADCYLGVAVYAAPPQPGMQRKKEMVLHCHWLWCERDGHALPDTLPDPTFTIETSAGNYQDWWRMDAPLSLTDAEDYAERIAGAVGCAPMKDATRVLRIVGMKNHKPTRAGEVARIVDETGAVYSLSDFAHLPRVSAPAAPVREGGPRGKIGEGHRHHELLSLAGSLRRRGLSHDTILAALREMNETQCDPPKSDAEIEKIAGDASGWEPAPVEAVHRSQAAKDYTGTPPEDAPAWTPPANAWPEPLADEAYYGLAGGFVRAVESQSEADPVAILGQFLVLFGNCAGRSPYYLIEADKHHANLNLVTVGDTSSGRKGVALNRARQPFATADERWEATRVKGGLSSAEGLIWQVRDPIYKDERDKETKELTKVMVDLGIADKRFCAAETEFSGVLRQFQRDGNNLSGLIRDAFDRGNLESLTKNNPAKATGAHISILGHITKDELLRYLDTTEAANGLGNRFLWLCVKRSKYLPDGGRPVDLAPLTARLADALAFARTTGLMTRDDDARTLWHAVYRPLSEGKPGLLGAMIARAAPIVVRLSMIYALLDCSNVIRKEHLTAAIALWDYAEASARYIFGDAMGDAVADEILGALRRSPSGLTRTQISEALGRNQKADRINRALALIERNGLARFVREDTGGRPGERWFAATPGVDSSNSFGGIR